MKTIYINNLIILVLSVLISLLLKVSHILLPFMFGPIIAAILCIKVFKLDIKWPFWLSQIGLICLGVQIGSTFTRTVIKDIQASWFSIVLVSVLLLVLALLIAYFFKKIAKVNTETAILSVIPGALNQMLVMAEEDKKANILVVSLTQTSRIIFVVILVPLISYFFKNDQSSEGHIVKAQPLTHVLNFWQVCILIVSIILVYWLMTKINFPTKQLLAPIVVLIIWNISTDITFALDNWLLASAQVIYMIRIGLQIARLLSDLKGRIAVAIAFQNIMLIIAAFIMVCVLHLFTHDSINELFLGAAPGGMSQIVLVAIETGADVAMISSYHIFRIFFILFLIAPLINYFLKYRARQQ
ncbi:AbrB family transcriptional regulator [Staphylococcus pasteuri]|uniref:AbrB family transcriptional regulator n=1 Tax=Staphylococcus pasteuri TaxID=45972 RepID=UPI001C259FBC|nr:AbrB family transcriptional regulator [Staphylococcus pasteuri]MCO0860852.1 AbrB family transcriptional regulator [Staphylococcus pasteuri]MCO5359618.1 AbrB family transcriptional regulator [Staphylococcus pasteuri]